jgi:hypothetical protein
LTSALYEWSASRLGLLTPVERALNTNFIGSCVGLRDGLDAVEKRKIGGTEENH